MALETLLLVAGATTVGGMAIAMRGARSEAESTVMLARREAAAFRGQAVQRRRMSSEEQHIMHEDMRRTLKSQHALYAKSGVTMSGSPMQVQLRTVETMAADIGMLAYIRETEAGQLEERAAYSMMEVGAAKRLGKLRVGQALFGGIGQLATMGLGYKLNTM